MGPKKDQPDGKFLSLYLRGARSKFYLFVCDHTLKETYAVFFFCYHPIRTESPIHNLCMYRKLYMWMHAFLWRNHIVILQHQSFLMWLLAKEMMTFFVSSKVETFNFYYILLWTEKCDTCFNQLITKGVAELGASSAIPKRHWAHASGMPNRFKFSLVWILV